MLRKLNIKQKLFVLILLLAFLSLIMTLAPSILIPILEYLGILDNNVDTDQVFQEKDLKGATSPSNSNSDDSGLPDKSSNSTHEKEPSYFWVLRIKVD